MLNVASDDTRPPLTVPVWYHCAPGSAITFFTGTQGRKARKSALIGKASVVSLLVQREEFPYKYVTVEGAVVRTDQPPTAEQMLAIVRRYLPEDQAQGLVAGELAVLSPTLELYTVRPDRWLAFDFGEQAG